MILKDRFASLFIFVLVALGYFFSLEIPEQPARIPRYLLAILAIFAGVLLWSTFTRRRLSSEKKGEEEVSHSVGLPKRLKVVGILVLTGVYIAVLPVIGFLLSTPLTILGLMLIMGERHKIRLVAVAVFATLMLYYAFSSLLKVPLPTLGYFLL